MTERTKIIAVIPAYNEEKYIGTVVLKTRQYAGEVIVIDDGSTDRTGDVARLAGATVIRHKQNKGYGASIRTLLAEAKKRDPDIVILLDADSQHNPDEIPGLIKPILDGYDLIIGSRIHQNSKIPYYRRLGQRVLSYLCRILSREKIADSECGFRAFSSKAIAELKLTQNGMAISAEMITAAAEKGLKIKGVPVSAIYTEDGSTLNPLVYGLGNLALIINMISERRPLLLFGLFGFIMTVLGLIAGARVLYTFSAEHGIATGTALLSVLFLIVGMFSIFTGIILNVLAKRQKD